MPFLTGSRCRFFVAVVARIVPESAALDAASRRRGLALVEEVLAARPAGVQFQLAVFLALVRWLPALRYGRPLERLAPPRQDAVLGWFQDAPAGLLRKGFWGLKTLAFLSYYGRPESGAAIGYRPERDGNRLLAQFRSRE